MPDNKLCETNLSIWQDKSPLETTPMEGMSESWNNVRWVVFFLFIVLFIVAFAMMSSND
jgi:hypothetical protein